MAISFLQGASNAADQSEYTFSSQNLGEAAADRYIAVCIQSRVAGTGTLTSSVTVAAVSATPVVELTSQATARTRVGIYLVAMPSGASGDVVVTFNATMARCAIQLYRLTGIDPTPYDTDTSTVHPSAGTLDVPAGGVALGCFGMWAGSGFGTVSWTGLTENYDQLIESNFTTTSASGDFESAQDDLSIGVTVAATGVFEPAGVFASFEPVLGGFNPAWAAAYHRRRRSA